MSNSRLKNIPLVRLLVFILVVQVVPVIKILLNSGRPVITQDAAFYQNAGWQVLNGGIPYLTMWDPKTPLNFLLNSITALVSGGNMLLLLYINVLLGLLVTTVTCWLLGLIMYRVSDDKWCATATAIAPLLISSYHEVFSFGYRPKYMFLMFGLLAILLALRERYILGMFTAALSTGFWQFGVAMMMAVCIICIDNLRLKQAIKPICIGSVAGTFFVVFPQMLFGSFDVINAMFIQTVFSPLMTTNDISVIQKVGLVLFRLRASNIIFILGFSGFLVQLYTDIRNLSTDHLWVYALLLVSTFQVTFLDFEGMPDTWFFFFSLAFGVGFFCKAASENTEKLVIVSMLVALFLALFLSGGTGVVFAQDMDNDSIHNLPEKEGLWYHTLDYVQEAIGGGGGTPESSVSQQSVEYENRPTTEDVRGIYWNKTQTDRCHYRPGGMQKSWVDKTGQDYSKDRCLTDLRGFVDNQLG